MYGIFVTWPDTTTSMLIGQDKVDIQERILTLFAEKTGEVKPASWEHALQNEVFMRDNLVIKVFPAVELVEAPSGLTAEQEAKALEQARLDCHDALELDGDEKISVAEDGVWVRAWIWVPNTALGIEDEEEEDIPREPLCDVPACSESAVVIGLCEKHVKESTAIQLASGCTAKTAKETLIGRAHLENL